MRAEYTNITIDGNLLHRMTLLPDEGIECTAACIFSHGQGDYGERYLDVLHPFTDRGIKCIVTDHQGHGRSTGKRGHIDSTHFIDKVIANNLEAAGHLPTGIAGHSMGGLLTLRHLALSLQGKLPTPDFCWVNAPLLYPGYGRPDWFIRLANMLATVAPSTTIHTGVKPEMCLLEDPSAGRLPKDPLSLGHRRVSIGWGSELIRIAEFTQSTLHKSSFNRPFLFTQGGADSVCPEDKAHDFFSRLGWPSKQYQCFPSMLHETFAEPKRNELFELIGRWIDEHTLAQQKAHT
ncbi:MAG: alpha/beta fold hydrolase [Rubritalea sp.]|uniref:alpha/beta fold hydrolase n=1 Tax=Rubritalea sp. TaxID=2109375 RepID=UPI00324293EE